MPPSWGSLKMMEPTNLPSYIAPQLGRA